MELTLLKNIGVKDIQKIEVYLKTGGYEALSNALKMSPLEIVEEVKKSGLRGRGGAGFPTGVKWGFLPKDGKPRYLICNADEGEPGTFKDRLLLEKLPHLVLEGIAISSFALGVNTAFIYIRGEFAFIEKILLKAIEEMKGKGFLGKNILKSGYNLEIIVHKGAGAYICGEETALIESLEGKRGYPRIRPPFPAVVGVYKCPTIVNNVETLSAVSWIVSHGGDNYAKMGTEKSRGTRLFCLSGHINKPGVYELELGFPLMKCIQDIGGGIRGGKKLKAVIPGGSSTPVLTADEARDVLLDFESVASAGSQLGSAAIIVMDETTCMVKAISVLANFYHHESCGQCTPCREGTGWMANILKRILSGTGKSGDIDLLLDISDNIEGKTICPMGEAAAWPVRSFVTKFREEFEEHLSGKCRVK